MHSPSCNPADERLEILERQLVSHNLGEIIKVLADCRPRANESVTAEVFRELREIAQKGDKAVERLLFRKNLPPSRGRPIHPVRSAWALLSYEIFYLNPSLGNLFAARLVSACLERPTDLVFSLSHSDAVSFLVKHNASEVRFSECKSALIAHQDSRALYALKALRWSSAWDDIRSIMLRSVLSPQPAIRIQAYWLLRERGSWQELRNFMQDDSVLAELRRNPNARRLLDSALSHMKGAPGDANNASGCSG